jgi:hypothetical protein
MGLLHFTQISFSNSGYTDHNIVMTHIDPSTDGIAMVGTSTLRLTVCVYNDTGLVPARVCAPVRSFTINVVNPCSTTALPGTAISAITVAVAGSP